MSGSVLLPRYFYRACQSSLFPSPVQVGRQWDKTPAETRRNILGQSSRKPSFLSLTKPSPKVCNKKDSNASHRPVLHTDCSLSDSKKGLCTLVPTDVDTLPYTKDSLQLSEEPPLPAPKVSECLNKTLEVSNLSLSSCFTSTPLLTQSDSVQLKMPPDGDSQCAKYTRNCEEKLKCDHAVLPAQRSEQLLHTNLWCLTILSLLNPICTIVFLK